MLIKILMLLVFVAITVAVGIACHKSAKNVEGFVLGGRSIGPWLSAFAYGTSYFSAVIFIGYAGQFGWKYGIASTWIGIGNAVIGSLIAWWVLAKRTRNMTHYLDSSTMPDYFGKRFNSKALRLAASAIVFVFLIPYTASLYNGLSRLFEMAFGIDYAWCVIAMAVLTAIYVVVGGYTATAWNDFIQGIIMLIGIVAVVLAVVNSNGGLMEAVQKLGNVASDADPGVNGQFATLLGPQPIYLLGVVVLTSLGTWGLPQMVGKFYAIKDDGAVKKGTIISTIFALIVAGGCYFLGGFGRLYSDVIEYSANGTPVYDSIVPSMLSRLPDVLIAVVVVLVLSASMSTLSSLVLTSSSTLTLDMIMPLSKSKGAEADEKKKMVSMRIFVVVFIIISSVIAIVQVRSSVTFIAQLMGISWGALAGAFLAPFLYSLYTKKVSRASVWVCFVWGVGVMVINMICTFAGVPFINEYFSSPINAGVLSMVGGLIIVPIVNLFTRAENSARVDEMFKLYGRKK